MTAQEKPSTPWLSIGLYIFGGFIVGTIGTLSTLSDREGPAIGLSIFVSGVLLTAFGAVLDKLSRIEHHLRQVARADPQRTQSADQ